MGQSEMFPDPGVLPLKVWRDDGEWEGIQPSRQIVADVNSPLLLRLRYRCRDGDDSGIPINHLVSDSGEPWQFGGTNSSEIEQGESWHESSTLPPDE